MSAPSCRRPREDGMKAGDEVAIAGRTFALDVAYAARSSASPPSAKRPCARRLLGYDPAYPWPGGRVEVELVPSAASRGLWVRHPWWSAKAWAARAGEPVGDVRR